jgi:hypothetical protein
MELLAVPLFRDFADIWRMITALPAFFMTFRYYPLPSPQIKKPPATVLKLPQAALESGF